MKADSVKNINDNHFTKGSQVCIKASGEDYLKGLSDIVSRMTKEKGKRGVLVSTIWSANALSRRLSLSKLPNGSMRVVDTVSLSLGSKIVKNPDFTFLPDPVPLESILVVMERMLNDAAFRVNFLIFDSLSFFRRYYTQGQLTEFFNYVMNRMLEEEVNLIVLDQEKEMDDSISKMMASNMDRVIDIETGGGDR